MADTHSLSVRPTAVAGLFYPADPAALTAQLEALLQQPGMPEPTSATRSPRALVVPHAGYVYSGPVAARAYASLGRGEAPQRIVLLGPSHHEWFHGMALPSAAAYATPLGPLRVDTDAVRALCELPAVALSDSPHAPEHSLEVQLPFLKRLAGSACIVPVVTGMASPEEVARLIDALWDDRTLIVVSSDLSHYHPYAVAQSIDHSTAEAIVEGCETLSGDQACGCVALNGLARAVRRRGLEPRLIDLRNSGDTAGDRHRVVGYGAFGFYDA